MSDDLSFKTLREANKLRQRLYRNNKGRLIRADLNWSIADWVLAFTGEFGEACNLLKKIHRDDIDPNSPLYVELKARIASELADAQIYLDLLAMKAGVDLGEAVETTFNLKSDEIRTPVKIVNNRVHRTDN